MKGPRGLWSPNLDPFMVLGMNETSLEKKRYYAKLMAIQEYNRLEKELQFDRLYRSEFQKLYGHLPIFITPEKHRKEYFITLPCNECASKAKKLADEKEGVDIYFVNASVAEIKDWVAQQKIPVQLINSKRIGLNVGTKYAKKEGIKKFPTLRNLKNKADE